MSGMQTLCASQKKLNCSCFLSTNPKVAHLCDELLVACVSFCNDYFWQILCRAIAALVRALGSAVGTLVRIPGSMASAATKMPASIVAALVKLPSILVTSAGL